MRAIRLIDVHIGGAGKRIAVESKAEEIGRGLGVTNVTLVAFLAETRMTVRDLLTLQPGDILQTSKPTHAEVILQVEGRNKFAGVLGRHKENRALKITRLAEVEEPL